METGQTNQNDNNLLNTIKSRCMKVTFENIDNAELKKFLEDNYEYKNIDDTMLKIFDGSIGRALKVKEKSELFNDINKILENLNSSNIINLLNNSESIYKGKEDINEILEYLNIYFLDKAKEEYHNTDKYLNAIKIVEDTKERLRYNSNYDMSIDNLLINIWEELKG